MACTRVTTLAMTMVWTIVLTMVMTEVMTMVLTIVFNMGSATATNMVMTMVKTMVVTSLGFPAGISRANGTSGKWDLPTRNRHYTTASPGFAFHVLALYFDFLLALYFELLLGLDLLRPDAHLHLDLHIFRLHLLNLDVFLAELFEEHDGFYPGMAGLATGF